MKPWHEIPAFARLSGSREGGLSQVRVIAFTAGAPQGAFGFHVDGVEAR